MGIEHTSGSMKKHLAEKRAVSLENGVQTEIQHSGIVFGGKVITDPKDVPSDDQITEYKKQAIELRKRA